MINKDTGPIRGEISLIDVASSTTYTDSKTIPPDDVWIFDPASVISRNGFGWGFMTSTGAPGTTYAWGAIHATITGKIVGLTVLIPRSGF